MQNKLSKSRNEFVLYCDIQHLFWGQIKSNLTQTVSVTTYAHHSQTATDNTLKLMLWLPRVLDGDTRENQRVNGWMGNKFLVDGHVLVIHSFNCESVKTSSESFSNTPIDLRVQHVETYWLYSFQINSHCEQKKRSPFSLGPRFCPL